MIQCTKQWTDNERKVLQRAVALLNGSSHEFLCNAVDYAGQQLFGSYSAPECVGIRAFVKELLGGEHTLGGWRQENDPTFDWDGEDNGEHTATRVEWARWMLGEIEADGSKFPVHVAFKAEVVNG
jgi:hypothetical protein